MPPVPRFCTANRPNRDHQGERDHVLVQSGRKHLQALYCAESTEIAGAMTPSP
jgi:hypothetical protein